MCQRFCSAFVVGGRVGRRYRPSGFTLIELMIVVAIIAILAAIAYPAYQDSVHKGWRAQGKSAILSSLQAEERYFSLNNTYVAYPPMGTLPATFMQTSGPDGTNPAIYTLVAGPCQGAAVPLTQCVGITATLVIAGSDPLCPTLYADTTGLEMPTPGPGSCWP